MKKKLLLVVSMMALLVCLLAVCVSAENNLNPQTSNGYGTLSTFDESITVGRTDNQHGFSPYINEAGTTYARVVIGDGTTFYTFPTAYMYSSTSIYGRDGKTLWSYDLTSLNSAMETATGTNPGWTRSNVYRIELPYNTAFLNGDATQKFYAFSNVIEIYLQPNMTTIDTGSSINCLFHSCEKLTTIHNIDSFVFKHNNNLSGTFQNCKSLTSLTLGVSSAITKINNSLFNNCTSLVSVNALEAFPNATEIGNSTFINCYELKTISSSRNDGVIELRHTYIDSQAFQNCDSIKAIKFTGSKIKILQQGFHSLDSLEYIYFPKDSTLELPSCEVFSNNEQLKAVAFPDNCTVIPDRGFKNCKGLMAVYLPANLDELKTNGGNQGAFAYNDDMYFVQEWFSVLDENGEFLFNAFEMPARPDVYYFPSNMTKFYTRDSGTGFDGNYNLNPVMVLPESITTLWVYDGCFYNCGTTSDQKTIVMLGNMETVRFNMRDSRTVGINYVFANPLDKDLSSVNIVDTSDRACSTVTNETIYFCSTGATYKLAQWQVHPDPATFTSTTEQKHIANPNATTTTEATCTEAAVKTYYCFCTKEIKQEEIGEASGHNEGELIAIIYGDADKFFARGDHHYDCTRCDETVVKEGAAPIIFKVIGYTYTEADNPSKAIMQSFAVNKEALRAYNEKSENDLVGYGLLAANTSVTEAFENGVAKISAVAKFQDTEYDIMELKIKGLNGVSESIGAYANVKFHCCAYVLVQNGESVDSYYATEVLDDDLTGVEIAVTDELSADMSASYNDIYINRNPQ